MFPVMKHRTIHTESTNCDQETGHLITTVSLKSSWLAWVIWWCTKPALSLMEHQAQDEEAHWYEVKEISNFQLYSKLLAPNWIWYTKHGLEWIQSFASHLVEMESKCFSQITTTTHGRWCIQSTSLMTRTVEDYTLKVTWIVSKMKQRLHSPGLVHTIHMKASLIPWSQVKQQLENMNVQEAKAKQFLTKADMLIREPEQQWSRSNLILQEGWSPERSVCLIGTWYSWKENYPLP